MAAYILRRGDRLSGSIEDYPEGIVVPVDKPWRWTSADVIRKVKWLAVKHFGKRNLKVGHAGTLDPLATGVLLVCIGKATKLADSFQKHPKQYLAGITFGATTPSYDREKEIDRRFPLDGVSEAALRAVLPAFLGGQEQVAPLFSAKSVDGVRAYEMARRQYKAGGVFDHAAADILNRQHITISRLELVSYCAPLRDVPAEGANPRINVISLEGEDLPRADILVDCSKGTYIRALARDLGEALGSGAFLDGLRRTATGDFRVEEALTIDEIVAILAQ